jgi:hypothetical protein
MDRRRWLQYERSQRAPDRCLFGAAPQRREEPAQRTSAFLSSREENGEDRCWSAALRLDRFRLAEAPAAVSLRPLSESNREAHPQSVTAITPQESQNIGFVSTPAQASSEVPNRPTKWTQSPRATDKLATTNSGGAKAIRGNRRNLAVMRLASRRRSAVEKGVPRTIKMLIKMWHRTSRTGKLALNESH